MVMRLSTSSFRRSGLVTRVPWAFAIACFLLVGVESGLRMCDPKLLIPYNLGLQEYIAIAQHLNTAGSGDLCFVGSSRTREGILMPDVVQMLKDRFRPNLSVANYSRSGAKADDVEALVKTLVRDRYSRPKLIVYGLSPRQLLGGRRDMATSSIFWDINDFRRIYEVDADRAIDSLPHVVRNEIAKFYWTFRYRSKFGHFIMYILGFRVPCPINGDLTPWQLYTPQRSLKNQPVSDARVRRYVHNVSRGDYWLSQYRIDRLEAIMDFCTETESQLILIELPLSNILKRHLPAGTYQQFLSIVKSLSKNHNTRFVTLKDLGLVFRDEDFREQSHLNFGGARRLTQALLDRVVIPQLTLSPRTH